MKSLKLLILVLALTASPIAKALAAAPCPGEEPFHWGYTGDTGPANWGNLDASFALCNSGIEQTPIDLKLGHSISADFPQAEFHYDQGQLTVLDHDDQTTKDDGAGNYIVVGGIRYQLINDHFHAPSEHTIDGQSFPLELHLVHKSSDGKLGVVGVLVKAGAANQGLLKPPSYDNYNGIVMYPNQLLPASGRQLRYFGSLTTPACGQGVLWTVMKQPITMSQQQIDAIKASINGCWGTDNNARPVQPLNNRFIMEGGPKVRP